ncbi:MAG: PEP-CTERM sorting domain-containing protein [Phycisphaerae bacterium]
MKRGMLSISIAALSALAFASSAQAGPINLLGNASFEDPFAPDGPPFAGNWEPFDAGAGTYSVQGSLMPRTGAAHLQIGIDNTDNAFAGAFQDAEGLTAGDIGTFSGWHMTPSNPLDVGIEFRIEWRDSVNNVEIARTPNMTTIPSGSYTQFSISDVVPFGADTARVVYAIQTFGGDGPSNSGEVYIDDASFSVIPEPSTLAMLSLVVGFVARKRR